MPTKENVLNVLARLDRTNCWTAREHGMKYLVTKDPDRVTVIIDGLSIPERLRLRDQFTDALRPLYVRRRNPKDVNLYPPSVTYEFLPAVCMYNKRHL